MSKSCSEIVDHITKLFPDSLAEAYDNTGLILGSTSSMVDKVLVCLDITNDIVTEAIDIGAQMIVSHHPLIFKPIKNISYDSKPTSTLVGIIKENINVYSLHTNFDNACSGMNDILADKFDLKNINKFEGGTGRYGELASPTTLKTFAQFVKQLLGADYVKVTGDINKMIRRVGIVGGAGSDFIVSAVNAGCDVLLTGDLKHHNALDALDNSIALIDGSHYFTELVFIPYMVNYLNSIGDVEVIRTSVDTNPFYYI